MEDGALRRRIRQWLQAGVRDPDGQGLPPVTGTPPGGTVSPVLAQVCLPDGRDVGCDKVGTPPGRGAACLSRSADDVVGAWEDQADAERVYNGRGQRREQCRLALSAAKTRLIPCSRSRQAGQTRCAFLGCALRWGQERKGHEHLKRPTARTQLRRALRRCPAGCKEHRHLWLSKLCKRLHATLRGDSNDDGVHGTAARLQACCNRARRIVLQWRNRRRQRHRETWQGYTAVLERCQVARPRSVGRPKTRPATLKTSADVRQRVVLKSPVRENRTPGSVRGPSGHWRSYRDGR